MNKRPVLDLGLNSDTFPEYYYSKAELIDFCKANDLQATGNKAELTERIAEFLSTGNRTRKNHARPKPLIAHTINLDTAIETNFVCSEKHRAFFKSQIGDSFSFNVTFQKWLKSNAGKCYGDAVTAYYQILEDKKNHKAPIDNQFEYNTYIRDFFNDNKGKSIEQAIKCWKYKKSLKGHHRYEKSDLAALNTPPLEE